MSDVETVAHEVLQRYPLEKPRFGRLGGGLINDTFAVFDPGGDFVLQRLHPVFSPRIHHNIQAVTERLAQVGLATPRLCATRDGALWVEDANGRAWRLMTRVPGHSLAKATEPSPVRGAARHLARVHEALTGLRHTFVGLRDGVHDTAAHLQRLRQALAECAEHRLAPQVQELASPLLAAAEELPSLASVPERPVHGDPKLNNFVFDQATGQVALVDLDTCAPMPLPLELGDAWRSWCNRSGEDDPEARFDLEFFEASVVGYAEGLSAPLDPAERSTLGAGVEWITLELAARFATDALRESYFGWDRARYPRAGEHNLVRARGQWRLHQQVVRQRAERERILARILGAM